MKELDLEQLVALAMMQMEPNKCSGLTVKHKLILWPLSFPWFQRHFSSSPRGTVVSHSVSPFFSMGCKWTGWALAVSTDIRSVPGLEADMDTLDFSMWREHLLAIGAETNVLFHNVLQAQFLECCFLVINLPGVPQLCRAWLVSEHL